jgi:hypothetical protein
LESYHPWHSHFQWQKPHRACFCLRCSVQRQKVPFPWTKMHPGTTLANCPSQSALSKHNDFLDRLRLQELLKSSQGELQCRAGMLWERTACPGGEERDLDTGRCTGTHEPLRGGQKCHARQIGDRAESHCRSETEGDPRRHDQNQAVFPERQQNTPCGFFNLAKNCSVLWFQFIGGWRKISQKMREMIRKLTEIVQSKNQNRFRLPFLKSCRKRSNGV